ncbi:hypothetical protein FJ365_00265 [Candidatus Dependentiae bacterium]|nr:hypothetical protein [Candidatus Dependentiae bacterium]
MNLNTKTIALSFASLLIALVPLEAMETRRKKRGHSPAAATQSTTMRKARKQATQEHPDVAAETCQSLLPQTKENFTTRIEAPGLSLSGQEYLLQAIAEGNARIEARWNAERWEKINEEFDRTSSEIEAAITQEVAPVPFGPKTLKETIDANTLEARILIEKYYHNNSKANATINLRIHDLLFPAPAATHSAFGKATRRIASTISWLAGKPSALQQAIMDNDLIAVFKLHITNPEDFYTEVTAQGLDDMNDALQTMRNLVDALFGYLEPILLAS